MRAALAANGLEPGGAGAQSMPRAVGDPDRAVAICRRALEGGVYAQAIRPPTVPEGTSRLRLTVLAGHEPDQLTEAAAVLAGAFRAVSADGDWSIDLPDPEPGELRVERHGWRVVQTPETPVPDERAARAG